MNEAILEKAIELIPDRRVLINAACRRAGELARGGKPLIRVLPGEEKSYLDIALEEIAEGKIAVRLPEPELEL